MLCVQKFQVELELFVGILKPGDLDENEQIFCPLKIEVREINIDLTPIHDFEDEGSVVWEELFLLVADCRKLWISQNAAVF